MRQTARPPYAPPRTPIEEVLTALFTEVLGRRDVGVHDSFLDLGGHSLEAMRLLGRIRTVLARELPLRALLSAPTVAGLARSLDAHAPPGAAAPTAPIGPADRSRPLPLSFGQARLFFLDRLKQGSAVYNVPVFRRLRGPLDVAALDRALAGLVERHETLRTTFAGEGEEAAQRVAPAPRTIGLAASRCGSEAEALRRAREELERPFDLVSGPPWRAALLRLDDEDHVLLLTVHHAVFDAWSEVVLERELAALYDAFAAGRPSPLPPLPIQYADFSAWQRDRLSGPRLAEQLGFWTEQLAGAPPWLELPTDRPRPPVETFAGGFVESSLARGTVDELTRLAQGHGATLYMALLAAFHAFLARHAGQDDVVVGTPIASRTREELEGLIGFFVNTLALRARIEPGSSFTDLLAQVRARAFAAYAHQDLPFELVVQALNPPRHPSRSPVFQVTFALQNVPRSRLEPPAAVSFAPFDDGLTPATYDINLVADESPRGPDDGLTLLWKYRSDLFDRTTIARLAARFEVLLAAILERPGAPLDDLELLPPDERETLAGWARTGRSIGGERLARCEVLDRAGRPAPIGVAGDLRVDGAATGQRARFLAGGDLELVGEGAAAAEADVATADRRASEAPLDPIESTLRALFAEVLVVEEDEVGPDDSFFELGGHSLLGTRLISRVRAALGRELRLQALFDRPTVAGLGELLRASAPAAATATIPRADRSRPVPLSFAQARLFFLDQLDPGSTAYNVPVCRRVHGALDAAALGRALADLAARHEILRTTFALEEGQAVQRVGPPPDPDLLVVRAADSEDDAIERARAEAGRPFDLATGPLLRATLFRCARERHVLLLTLHHAVFDAWSEDILLAELAALYREHARGVPAALPPLAIQYADFAAWQRRWLSGHELDRQLGYWSARLAGAEPLDLPTDRPRPPMQTSNGAHVAFDVPSDLHARFRDLGRERDVTLQMMYVAAFSMLLSRYSGQDDVLIGSPVANRGRSETEPLIGFFVNTLVLRADLSGRPTFLELMARVRGTALAAYAHQDAPFEQVVDALAPERDMSRSPIFQVMLVVHNAPHAGPDGDLPLQHVELHRPSAPFDLTLSLTERADGLSGSFEYNTDLFDRTTVERMARHLLALIAGATADPTAPVDALAMLSPEERELVVTRWNATAAPFDDRPVPALFGEQVMRTPEATALRFDGQALTYTQLDRRVNQLAHRLRAHGVGPDTLVALFLERSIDLVVGMLAAMAAGGAYLPLDLDSPPERLAFVLGETRAPVVLTHTAVAGRLPAGAAVLCVDAIAGELAAEPTTPPAVSLRPAHLAYAMYTSGSTGRPKAVMVTHEGLANLVPTLARTFGIGPGRRVLQFTSPVFDMSIEEIFVALLSGATLVLAPREELVPGEPLLGLLEREEIHAIAITPSALGVLPAARLPHLRGINCGGEACTPGLVERWAPGRTFVNAYGPTENTVDATMTICRPGPGAPSIGAPLPNVRVYVVDGRFAPVPIGVPGELVVAGAGLARGYLARPDLTADRFAPDPFSPTPGGRVYRTGDRVRWLERGELQFLGRLDDQVKIRGHRIEPGEVEAALREVAPVRDVTAVARDDGGGVRLVAYLVPLGDARPPAADLRALLARRLPEPMVPSAFVWIDAIPLTPQGKVNRRALPAPPQAVSRAGARTHHEEAVADAFAATLGLAGPPGPDGDFFDLGGHSLAGMLLVGRLRALLGVEVPLRAIFEHPSVAGLAREIESIDGRGERARIPAADRSRPIPLSFAQARLVFLAALQPDSAAYNVPLRWRLRGRLDPAALDRALAALIERHQALRTTFDLDGDEPAQRIAPPPGPGVLATHAVASEEDVARLERDDAERPFDLATGPLLRASLLRLGDEDHVLLLTLHHAVFDAWSEAILVRELAALYDALVRGRPAELPPLAIQCADHAAWQRGWLDGPRLAAQIAFWRRALDGAPPCLELPTDFPRPTGARLEGGAHEMPLGPELSAALRALGRRHDATLFMTFAAAWAALLARLSGQPEVVIGTPIANRTHEGTEGLIGLFLNLLPLRVRVDPRATFEGLVGHVKQVALAAYQHQDLPFEKLVEELNPARDHSRSPIFQAGLVFQSEPGGEAFADLTMEPVPSQASSSKFDVTLNVMPAPGGLVVGFEYRADLFSPATIRRMAGQLRSLLEEACRDARAPLSRVSLLDEADRRLLAAWNDTGAGADRGETLDGLVAAQAARTPGAIALEEGERRMTYGQLADRATRIARRLVDRGVRPGDRVVVHGRRSIDLVAAALGVLRAGAAYVPLDPVHPAARLRRMASDARPRAFVVEPGREATFAELGGAIVAMEAGEGDGEADAGLPDGDPDRLAYVIYTSGSTGTPKGVGNSHRGVVNTVRWWMDAAGIAAGDRVSQYAAMGFDAWAFEVWPALAAGATLCLIDEDRRLSAPEVLGWLAARRITIASFLPPALAEGVIELPLPPDLRLRALLTGSDRVQTSPRRPLPFSFINTYGPTECAIVATHYLAPAGELGGAAPPIGRPLPGVRLHVVDDDLAPVPLGSSGELCIAGAGVGPGYFDRPALTAERFVPDPHAAAPGQRMYRSGDLVRWRPGVATGALEFLGRVDQQVKLRGFRIELGEIESVLRAHPDVREAAVAARGRGPEDRQLVAYVVARGAAPSEEALRVHLRGALPEYMVPGAFVSLDALPLTPNGKLDRAALPAPPAARESVHVPPRGPLEETLCAAWAEVLGVPRVGIHDSFFDLGGHSLSAVRLAALLRQRTSLSISVQQLMTRPTVAALVGEDARATSPLVPLRRGGRGAPLVLVHGLSGDIFAYRSLAAALHGRTVYGLRSPHLEAEGGAPASLRELAAEHAAALRGALGRTRFHLGGWSAGGVLAHEIARALGGDGRVLGVVLLDSFVPTAADADGFSDEGAERGFAAEVIALQGDPRGIERAWTAPRGDLPALMADALGTGGAEVREQLARFARHYAMQERLTRSHAADTVGAPVLVVHAAGDGDDTDRSAAWSRLGPTRHVRVTGDHHSILRQPIVGEVARAVAEWLAARGDDA